MRIRRLKLIGVIAFCAVVTICVSLLVWPNIALAVVCFLSCFMVSAVVYYRVEKKRFRFEAHTAIERVNEELQFISNERLETADELRQQKELLQDIISAIPYHIFWKDTDSVYRGCNKQFAQAAGVERVEDIIGKNDYDLPWKVDQAAYFIECDKEIIRTGISLLNTKGTLLDAQGNTIDILADKVPLYDADGKVTGILGIYTDITKLKSAGENPGAESPGYSEAISDVADGVVQKTQGDEDEHPGEVKQKTGDDGKPNILVVDDVPENRMLLDVLLTKAGCRIQMCCDGKEAVDLANNEKFDLILMDIQMPVMDGLEATKIIKSSGPNSRTPIIAMTAIDTKGDEMFCFEAGCDAYIAKPIKRTILLDKIEMFLHQTKQIEAADRGEDIVSALAENPSYHDMIDMFVNNLPKRLEDMQIALDEQNLLQLLYA